MKWVYKIDSTTYEDPFEWEKADVVIKRGADLPNGIGVAFNTQLVWRGDAYDYLITAYDTDSWCRVFEVELFYECDGDQLELGTGFKMFANEFEIDRIACTIKVPIHENTYASIIAENKKIECSPDSPVSKSGATIASSTGTSTSFFDPNNGAYVGSVKCWTVDFVLKYIIQYISDGVLTCDPVPFSATGDFPDLVMTMGSNISTTTTSRAPLVTFDKVYDELRKRFNLGFYMNGTVLVIDYLDNIYTGSSGVTIENAPEFIETFKTELAYTKVRFGTATTLKYDGGVVTNWRDIPFFNFKEEEYGVDIICNVDQELDLTCEYVTDSNVIEDSFMGVNTDYDDEIFIIEAEPLGAFKQAIQYDVFNIGLPKYQYNKLMTNREVATRFR